MYLIYNNNMSTGIDTLTYPTINGLKSLNLDELNSILITSEDIVSNNIDGKYFSIDLIEANNVQVDSELNLTNSGFIIVGKGSASEVIITDNEIKYLEGMNSNIQNQINVIDDNIYNDEITINDNTNRISVNENNIISNTNRITTNENDIIDIKIVTDSFETVTYKKTTIF